MSRSRGTRETQGVNGDAAVLQRWLEAAGAGDGVTPCPYVRHRVSDWRRSPEHPWVCGVCHPPAVPALVGERVEVVE